MCPRSPMDQLERLDRRAFLRGMMVTSAGLLVPRATLFLPVERCPTLEDWWRMEMDWLPKIEWRAYYKGGLLAGHWGVTT